MKQQETDIHVFQKHGQLFTTSIDVAEKFGKRHDRVIRKIVEIADPRLAESTAPHLGDSLSKIQKWFSVNFIGKEYLGENGKKLPMYEMTKAGFSVLAMGFTGVKALEWKIKYESAFSAMERAILNQHNLSWQAQRQQGKIGRREETDTIKDFVEYAKGQGSSKAEFYYKHLTTATYKALFIVKDKFPGSFRDMLDNMQLSYLSAAEYVAANAIKDGMAQSLYYKDIYTLAKAKLEQYDSAVGATPVIAARQQMALPQLGAN